MLDFSIGQIKSPKVKESLSWSNVDAILLNITDIHQRK